jgi:hypothetical protein
MYVAIWICIEFVKRGGPVWARRATSNQELDFSSSSGALKGVAFEFFGLFETRRKTRRFYRNLMAHAREKSGLPQ